MALDTKATSLQLPAARKGKGKGSSTHLQLKSLLSLPPELILHIFHLAAHSFVDPVARQHQQITHSSINKLCYKLGAIHRDSYVVASEQTTDRLADALREDQTRRRKVKQVELHMPGDNRTGELSAATLLLSVTPALESFALRVRDHTARREGATDGLCKIVLRKVGKIDLRSFDLRFYHDYCSLELGGALAQILSKWSNLKKLSLPLLRIPKGFVFPFRPSLSSLSLHLSDAESIKLLSHLIPASSATLRHLKITIHNTFELSWRLEWALIAVAPSLLSLTLWTAVPKAEEGVDPRSGKQHTPMSLAKVYPRLRNLNYLALVGELVSAPPPILLPSLRQLDFLCGPFNTYEVALKEWFSAMRDDPARRVPFVRLLGRGLTEFVEWIRWDLEALAKEARVTLWYEEDGLGNPQKLDASDDSESDSD
ncbi:hypothetical protein BCR35DRAFT_313699 [Leucosporidium creatinivorum]|uniref:Uncharacterized protein n=1 Tax=Leucosporidium creatinivorum TaxID=106004 RepID=A0A1Y2FEH7_9BASI|nr:hypothetical protein BCR35DRAFT_313699 [Leucosporidium creatinivorum]